jgi:hypothetical protein
MLQRNAFIISILEERCNVERQGKAPETGHDESLLQVEKVDRLPNF